MVYDKKYILSSTTCYIAFTIGSVAGSLRPVSNTLNPEVVKRALLHCTNNIVKSSIDPFVLARRLHSNEIISKNVYMEVRDKESGDSRENRIEKILDHLKDLVKNDASIFTAFLNVLSDLGRDDLTDTIMKKYSGE